MLQRLAKPQPLQERKPFHYLKCLIAGFVAANVYQHSYDLFTNKYDGLNTLQDIKEFLAKKETNYNRTAAQMLGGGIRFVFYDMFKRFFSAGFGEKWSDSLRWVTYGLSSVAAEFLAVTVSVPLENTKIFSGKQMTLDEINKMQSFTTEEKLKLMSEETVNTTTNYYKGYRQTLMRNLPCTAVTFTTFEVASEIWYDYILRTPKEKYNGLNQSLFSFINGCIAGAAYYGVSKIMSNSEVPQSKTASKTALLFYTLTTGMQFTLYNFMKVILNGETLGQGTNSKIY